jgi:glutaredoxin
MNLDLIKKVITYQKEKGTEFDPQLILFTLHGCPVCKELTSNLMVDGYSYDTFDCNKDEHSDIADFLEDILNTNHYPIIFITYPENKVITMDMLDENKPIYPQITEHLN